MGGEFGQEREWNHDASLDWHEAAEPFNAGLQRLVRDLNHLYRGTPALHARDCEAEGFSWIDCSDAENSTLSYLRRVDDDFLLVICNFTPVVRKNYRVGMPREGRYREILNTDSAYYGGSDVGNGGAVDTDRIAAHGQDHSLSLTLPPLAVIILRPEGNAG